MKIACVVTVCAALISMFLCVGAVRSKRLPQSKDHLLQPKLQNDTDISEITFTTLQPEVPFSNHKTRSNVYLNPHKSYVRVRPGRSSLSPRRRALNRYNGIRRRRQLQRSGIKPSHVGRSYDLSENHIDSQHIETIQGPAEAFDDGAIHLEPVYRVTKNKNVFDSIIDVIKRIFDPPKSVGPLVGPFNFPGVGEKVYIRILEPIRPDHLVVRLVTHLPASDVETVLDKDILPIDEVLKHAVIPSIEQQSITLPNEGLTRSHESHEEHSDVHLLSSSDSVLSGSNTAQVSKPNTNRNVGRQHFRTYKIHFKPGEVNSIERIRYQKRNPSMISSGRNNHVNSMPRTKLANHTNETTRGNHLRANRFQNSFDQVYEFHSPVNESSKENFDPLTIDFHAFHDATNISSPKMVHNKSIVPFENFPSSQVVNTPAPISINRPMRNHSETEDRPKYSIEFASKKMRYLNLDGSVESAITEENNDNFKPMEISPVVPYNPYWDRFRRMHVETKEETNDPIKKDFMQERSDKTDDEYFEEHRKSGEEKMNNSENTSRSTRMERHGSRCCLEGNDENKRTKSSYDEEHRESSINNSTSSVNSASVNGSTDSLMLHRLQSSWKNSTNTRGT
ncbi:hypothetical protein ANTPLA_LOCUS3385 [Anthophora plagiata]